MHFPMMSERGKSPARPLPRTPDEWLDEILVAWDDAAEAEPYGPLAGAEITDATMFHLAPMVAFKFRGWKPTGKKADRIRKTALANYVVNTAHDAPRKGLEVAPRMAFALVYVAAHFSMDLVDEETAHEILEYCESRLAIGLN